MDCKHVYLTKVSNMNPATYRCDRCHELYDVTLNPVARPKMTFPTDSKEGSK